MADGRTVLLTGLPSAGKTTVATAAREALLAAGRRAEVLDGDVVRRELWPELGLSPADRESNLVRIGTVALLLARNGITAIVAAIAPYGHSREALRTRHTDAGVPFSEVHIATPVEVCRRRDVKGLYARHARGEITGLTGVDAVYERPLAPELRIDTSLETVDETVARLVDFIALGHPAPRSSFSSPRTG
ncbi:adenylyl-sulfate kinase [Amycolatopsis sp. NPDC059657]|uniref:adenylyl-sulfate kinase n=1 Tax=Amycolatopsis sp. NPDC059657 TaxID=3346899 RepID=UPI00366E8B71